MVPLRKTRIIEQVIEKPGPIVEIEIPNLVDVNIVVDEFVPRPVYEECFIPIPIGGVGTEFSEHRRAVAKKYTESYNPVIVGPSQWNVLVNDMNSDLPNEDFEDLLVELTDNDDEITPELRKMFKYVPVVESVGSIGMELLQNPPLNWGRKVHKEKAPIRSIQRKYDHNRGSPAPDHLAKPLAITGYAAPRSKGDHKTIVYS